VSADATEIADRFGLTHAAAAMALLRLARQGLVHRYVDPDDGCYFYELSERGHARVAFFRRHHSVSIMAEPGTCFGCSRRRGTLSKVGSRVKRSFHRYTRANAANRAVRPDNFNRQ